MNEIGSLLAAGGAAAAAVARYRRTRPNTMTPGQRYLLVVLFGLGAALTLDVPTIQASVATFTGLPYLARLLVNVSAMAAVFSATAMVVGTTATTHRINGATQVRWCAGVGVIAVGFMMTVLLGTDAQFDPDFAEAIASHNDIAACQVVFWVYMAGCIGRFVALMRRYLSRPDVRPLMHGGMVAVTMAGLFGVVWLVFNALVVVMQRFGGRFGSDPLEMSRSLGAATVSLVAIGLTLPQWTPYVRRTAEWCRTWRTLRRLNPLWLMMTDLVPEVVALQPEMSGNLDLVLYRKVIEIRDVQLRLINHAPPDIDDLVICAERAGFHDDVDRPPTRFAAARLACAIANYRAGQRPGDSGRSQRPDGVFTDIRDEAEWLAAVYVAMTSDPIVAHVVHNFTGERSQ